MVRISQYPPQRWQGHIHDGSSMSQELWSTMCGSRSGLLPDGTQTRVIGIETGLACCLISVESIVRGLTY